MSNRRFRLRSTGGYSRYTPSAFS